METTRITRVLLLLAVMVVSIYASPLMGRSNECCKSLVSFGDMVHCHYEECCYGYSESRAEIPLVGIVVNCQRSTVMEQQQAQLPSSDFVSLLFGQHKRSRY